MTEQGNQLIIMAKNVDELKEKFYPLVDTWVEKARNIIKKFYYFDPFDINSYKVGNYIFEVFAYFYYDNMKVFAVAQMNHFFRCKTTATYDGIVSPWVYIKGLVPSDSEVDLNDVPIVFAHMAFTHRILSPLSGLTIIESSVKYKEGKGFLTIGFMKTNNTVERIYFTYLLSEENFELEVSVEADGKNVLSIHFDDPKEAFCALKELPSVIDSLGL